MQINMINTFTDWTALGGAWSEQGVARILSCAKFAGVKKVYWRIFNGGSALYPSKVASVWSGSGGYQKLQHMSPPGMFDYYPMLNFNDWNCVTSAVKIGHDMGLKICGWYSVFEDDHGGGSGSSFVAEHPEFIQMDRNGEKMANVVDFFYDKVIEYKQKIIDEIAEFGLDGLLLDYARHNAVPSGDANTGIHRLGYNPEIVAAFKEKSGKDAFEIDPADEEWLSFKAEPHTRFITEVRRKMKAANPDSELALMLWPVDYFTWAAIDVPTLTERNVVDMLTGMSVKYSYHPREVKSQFDILKAQCKSDKVKIAPGICTYNDLPIESFDDYVEAAEACDVDELVLYEGNALVSDKLACPVGNVNYGFANHTRKIKATKVSGEIDWENIPKYDRFITMRGIPQFTPTNNTSFKAAYDDENLYIKFFCEDPNAENILPVARIEDHYYYKALNARVYWEGWDSLNLFLDPHNSHTDFHHLRVEPDGVMKQQTRVDGEWTGPWSAQVKVDDNGWGGLITVPFATIGVTGPQQMGINLVRVEKPAVKEKNWMYGNEVSGWFRTWYHTVRPEEFGKIEFE